MKGPVASLVTKVVLQEYVSKIIVSGIINEVNSCSINVQSKMYSLLTTQISSSYISYYKWIQTWHIN